MDVQRHPLDGLMTADEELQAQITELSLLSRAEQQHHLSTPRNSSSSSTTDSDASTQSPPARSTLSVLLSASSKLASESESHSTPTPSPSPLRAVFSPAKTRRALMLPTLSEDESEEATEVVPETAADSSAEEMSSGGIPPETDNADDQEANEEHTTEQCSERDEEQNDQAFEAMLEQLAHDANSLTLSVSDLTFRKLDLVREALQEPSRDDPRQCLGLSTMSTSLSQMKQMRTVIALDTIRLLLQGYPRREVSVAITAAVRQIFTQLAQEQGVHSLARAPVVLTSSNIARVVLIARQSLLSGEYLHRGSTRGDRMARDMPRTAIPASQVFPFRKSVRSPAHSGKSSEPRRTAGTTAPRTKSILATEGVHVLMQEKIAAFKYRPTTGGPPSGTFKIRRESAASADLAAQRRFKSLAYGKEQSRSSARSGSASSSTY